MEGDELVQSLADGLVTAVAEDYVADRTAALARSLFPQAASLRLVVQTGDSQVLAAVGSLLLPGHLTLALLPVSASAAGAALARRAPVHLTHEACQGRACYDFEGSSLLCLPITGVAAIDSSSGEHRLHLAGRNLGALLLSFQAPAQLDAPHFSRLLALATALVPRMGQAAADLINHCNLILGVEEWQGEEQLPFGSGSAAGEAADSGESDSSTSSCLMLTESESEGQEGPEGAQGSGSRREAEAAGEGMPQAASWAAGACRDELQQPPDDPGSAAAALLVAQPGSEDVPASKAAEYAAAAAGGAAERQQQHSMEGSADLAMAGSTLLVQRQQQKEAEASSSKVSGRQEPGSPSTHTEYTKPWAGPAPGSRTSSASIGSSLSPAAEMPFSEGGEAPLLLKHSPPKVHAEQALVRQAGSSWRRMLRFRDPRLERHFKLWLYGQLQQADLVNLWLTLAFQLILVCTGSTMVPSSLAPLTVLLILMRRPEYVPYREMYLLLINLGHAWCWHRVSSRVGTCAADLGGVRLQLQAAALPLLLFSRYQARFCAQAPLQLLMFLLRAWQVVTVPTALMAGSLESLLRCSAQSFLLGVGVPLLILCRLELRARRKFLACVPPPG